jgi:hypothetical protein
MKSTDPGREGVAVLPVAVLRRVRAAGEGIVLGTKKTHLPQRKTNFLCSFQKAFCIKQS